MTYRNHTVIGWCSMCLKPDRIAALYYTFHYILFNGLYFILEFVHYFSLPLYFYTLSKDRLAQLWLRLLCISQIPDFLYLKDTELDCLSWPPFQLCTINLTLAMEYGWKQYVISRPGSWTPLTQFSTYSLLPHLPVNGKDFKVFKKVEATRWKMTKPQTTIVEGEQTRTSIWILWVK